MKLFHSLPVLEPVDPLSSNHLIRDLDLDEEARKAALSNKPDEHQQHLSKTEQAIVQVAEQRVEARRQIVDEAFSDLKTAVEATPVNRTELAGAASFQDIVNDCMTRYRDRMDQIVPAVRNRRQALVEYNAFRDKHDLTHRPAHMPVSMFMHFSIVLLFLIFEVAMNAGFFYPASETGYLGAAATSLSVATVNILLALLLGYWPLRYINHQNTRHLLWIVPTCIVLITGIVSINAFAAHYREVALAGIADPGLAALYHLIAKPYELSLDSYLLFAFGLIIAAVATYKGYAANDPYPGYGEVTRNLDNAADDYAALQRSIVSDLSALEEKRIVPSIATYDSVSDAFNAISVKYASCLQLISRFTELDHTDNEAIKRAINHYRSLNMQIRTDGITPPSFTREPELNLHGSETKLSAAVTQSTASFLAQASGFQTRGSQVSSRFVQVIETAKDEIDDVMADIESCASNNRVPKLSVLRKKLIASETVVERPEFEDRVSAHVSPSQHLH
jgi:hypothetical protein